MDASDCLEQDVTPPINEVISGSRGLLILHGRTWYGTTYIHGMVQFEVRAMLNDLDTVIHMEQYHLRQ
jgi:hypothetical protein